MTKQYAAFNLIPSVRGIAKVRVDEINKILKKNISSNIRARLIPKDISCDYDEIGKFLKSQVVVDKLAEIGKKKYPDTMERITEKGYNYTGQKKVISDSATRKLYTKTRRFVYVNFRLNGDALTQALLKSPNKKSRQYGHIREYYGGKK